MGERRVFVTCQWYHPLALRKRPRRCWQIGSNIPWASQAIPSWSGLACLAAAVFCLHLLKFSAISWFKLGKQINTPRQIHQNTASCAVRALNPLLALPRKLSMESGMCRTWTIQAYYRRNCWWDATCLALESILLQAGQKLSVNSMKQLEHCSGLVSALQNAVNDCQRLLLSRLERTMWLLLWWDSWTFFQCKHSSFCSIWCPRILLYLVASLACCPLESYLSRWCRLDLFAPALLAHCLAPQQWFMGIPRDWVVELWGPDQKLCWVRSTWGRACLYQSLALETANLHRCRVMEATGLACRELTCADTCRNLQRAPRYTIDRPNLQAFLWTSVWQFCAALKNMSQDYARIWESKKLQSLAVSCCTIRCPAAESAPISLKTNSAIMHTQILPWKQTGIGRLRYCNATGERRI